MVEVRLRMYFWSREETRAAKERRPIDLLDTNIGSEGDEAWPFYKMSEAKIRQRRFEIFLVLVLERSIESTAKVRV